MIICRNLLEGKLIYVSWVILKKKYCKCAAGSIDPSHVLLAIGRSKDEAKGALRLSIDKDLTREDADYVIDALKAAVARLRG